MRIYLASSWRNPYQPAKLKALRDAGHEIYDFRNPKPDNQGFAWSEIDPNWLAWTPEAFVDALQHPIAQHGFALDKEALDWCEGCILLQPCGISANLELGYAIGQAKRTAVHMHSDRFKPELMYLLADFVTPHWVEIMRWAGRD